MKFKYSGFIIPPVLLNGTVSFLLFGFVFLYYNFHFRGAG